MHQVSMVVVVVVLMEVVLVGVAEDLGRCGGGKCCGELSYVCALAIIIVDEQAVVNDEVV